MSPYQGLNASFWAVVVVAGTFAAAGAVVGPLVGLAIASAAVMVVAPVFGALAVSLAAVVARTGWAAAATLVVTASAMPLAAAMSEMTAITWVVFAASRVAVTVALASLYAYIGCRALVGEKRYAVVLKTAIAFAAIGGTSFRSTDLTDANFTCATLKSTDFRRAILTRTCWRQVKKLDRVRPGVTYLQNAQLQQWLIGNGQNKNFDHQYLRGVNLKGASLADASFIGADLSEANLQDADLSRANLVQTQLDETDLTGATLTGACIEDWGITSHTKLDGVRCKFVFMRLPTKEDPNPRRKPDNWEEKFEDSDFADFIKPMVDTLDLYHNQSVDPRAVAIAFKRLAENYPEAELRIAGMEVRGEDKFLLRAKTAPDADKSQLNAEYFLTYKQLKALSEAEIRLLLAEKDKHILRLENMVMTALERPSFYSETHIEKVATMSNNLGGISIGGSVDGGMIQGDNNRAVQGKDNQAVLGDTNQVMQQKQADATAEAPLTKADVVALLAELETLIREADLPEDTKEEAIEDLSAAKKATEKEEPKKNVALANLESMATTLEKASKTIDAGQTLWSKAKPIVVKVAGWLGAAAGSHLLGL